MGWSWNDVKDLKLWEFVAAYDGFLLFSWDHTSTQCSAIGGLAATVAAIGGGNVKPPNMTHYHPYRKTVVKGVIKQENFGALKLLGDAYVKGKGP